MEGAARLVETTAEVVLLKGNPVEVVVDVPTPKLNPGAAVVAARANPVVEVAVVVPVFDASNESPGVTDVGVVLLGRLKFGTLGADVVVAIVLPRPNPAPVVMPAFGVPKVKPVDPVIGLAAPTPKLKPPVVVVAMGNPVDTTVVDAFAGSNVSPVATGMGGVPLLARFVKLGRLDTVDMDVVVAVMPPPRPKPVPAVARVVGVPKVKLVSPAVGFGVPKDNPVFGGVAIVNSGSAPTVCTLT